MKDRVIKYIMVATFIAAVIIFTAFAAEHGDNDPGMQEIRLRSMYVPILTVRTYDGGYLVAVNSLRGTMYKMPKWRTAVVHDSTRRSQVFVSRVYGIPDTIIIGR